MIILVSGTNGAGKTHLVRRILDLLPAREEFYVCPSGRAIPSTSSEAVKVIGRYSGPACGGCDTFSWKGAADDIEMVATRAVDEGRRVLLEGVIVSTWGRARLERLREHGLVVVHLSTTLEQCIDSVNDRRRARAEEQGKEFQPVKTDNIAAKHRGLENGLAKKRGDDIPTFELDRESAFEKVRELLDL